MNDKLVTIIGSSYFEPICVLLEKLEIYDSGGSSKIQANSYTNGFASSICLLAIACLESYVMRVRYINKANQNQIDKVSVPIYLKVLYDDLPFETELFEIHILRDILTHNHLQEISYSFDDGMDLVFKGIDKLSTGDRKYQKYVDTKNNITNTLGLNVNPIKVNSSDVNSVLQTIWKVLIFLENKNRNQCYVSHLSVKYKGRLVKFGDIVSMFDTYTQINSLKEN